MRALAAVQPGYISGETLVNADEREEILIISTWQDLDSWRNFKISAERNEIKDKIETLLQKETKIDAYFFGDLFLYR
jgi:heme-degrading monooxygenase HmoA